MTAPSVLGISAMLGVDLSRRGPRFLVPMAMERSGAWIPAWSWRCWSVAFHLLDCDAPRAAVQHPQASMLTDSGPISHRLGLPVQLDSPGLPKGWEARFG